MNRADELEEIVLASAWHMDVLRTARALDLPDWFIGAGAIVDLVWDVRFGTGFDPARVKDVDLVYFDATDLSKDAERSIETRLGDRWDVTNQAAVHTWFHQRFGGEPVPPLGSTIDGIATWPETGNVRRRPAGGRRHARHRRTPRPRRPVGRCVADEPGSGRS